MNLEKLVSASIIIILSLFSCYGIGAFLFADQNPNNWNFWGRFFIMCLFPVIGSLFLAIFMSARER
jgi:hypothetical protein